MAVRNMTPQDLDTVSALCIESFTTSVAGSLSDRGIATFQQLASSASLAGRMHADNLMLVFEAAGTLRGVIEFKEGRHVAMLFVDPRHQRQGVGKALLTAALQYARADTVTVRASLSSVPAYLSYGFQCTGGAAESAGLVYQPMALKRAESVQPTAKTAAA